MKLPILIAMFLLAAGVSAQERDFLTADETDQVREAQEPNARLLLYIQFARQRLDLLQQLVSEEKPGRSALIHDTLEDYSRIIETIDTVADDALKRKLAVEQGVTAVASAEKKMLETLHKVEEMPLKDLPRYQFALQQAIETTQDSADLSTEDLAQRSNSVAAKQEKEKKDLESMMSPKDLEKKKAADNAEKKEAETKRKPPALLRKGEKLPGDKQ